MRRAAVVRRGLPPWRLARLDRRFAGAALIALSVVGGLRLGTTATPEGEVVLVAARDLPANMPIVAADLRPVRVRAAEEVLAGVVRPPGERLAGQVPLYPVPRHGLIDRRALADAPRAGREISVPLEAAHALGGAIRVGERVDVLASFGRGGGSPRTIVVTRNAAVVAVGRSEGSLSGLGGEVASITLAVPPGDALVLAFAMRNAELDFVRSTGALDPGPEVIDLAALEVDAGSTRRSASGTANGRSSSDEGVAGCWSGEPGKACR